MKIFALVCLALIVSTAGYATRLQEDDGEYGITPTFLHQNQCLDLNGSVIANGCAMTGEDFIDSGTDVKHVFDFLIDGNRSNFTLTLTGTEVFAPENPPFFSYGAFVCTNAQSQVQCGPDPTDQMAAGSPTLSLDGKIATFDVTGANNAFVFFAVEPDQEGTVTATITQNTSSVPEPGSFSLMVLAGLAAAALGRRKLARLL